MTRRRAPWKADTSKYPLRRVVAHHVTDPDFPLLKCEKLECGHYQAQKQDIYGPTNAYRRRCGKCAREAT